MGIPKNIQKEHIIKTINKIEKEGVEIILKTDPIKSIIENYKKHISKTQLKDELYKWELINKYKGRPNTGIIDFYQEIKNVKYKNLVYAMGMAVLNHLAKERTEELRQLFIKLHNDSEDLTGRVKSFNKDTLKLYRELGETLQHHQDERSIATYLTFHNPDRYTLYKSSFYKKYCKLLNIEVAKKNEKYTHYLKLIDDLIKNHIAPDIELIEQVKGLIPNFYDGKNHKLLAQDILYQMLDKNDTLDMYKPKSVVNYSDQLISFLKQAKTDNLKTKHFDRNYNNTKVKVSFGQGVSARIPWISFLKEPFTTSEGIYPVYLYYKNIDKLVLAYGISETNKPQIDWKIINPIMIKDYFNDNSLSKPDRYGDSFLFKIYDSNALPSNKILDSDLNQIIEQYQSIDMENDNPVISQTDFNISTFHQDCNNANLKYSNQLVTRYISSLVTKPFVLLSGLSGSGKTKLAQSFAQWICEDKTQYCIVPVGADWTNREPLLGYVNALANTEYILPENGALQLLIEANKEENENKPYFLILDEMNLSHVERYFADFLSVMESKDKFKLHSDMENEKSGVPHELSWPKNIFVVGTVNIDETTYMFSPKVLDRANAIEFRVTEKEIEAFLNAPNEIDLEQLEFKGANMGASFVEMAKNKDFEAVNTENLNETLVKFFAELKKTGAEFGYRTGMEIHRLYNQISTVNTDISENDKIDIAVMQKLLPKLHGSRRKLCPILEVLAKLCVKATVDAKKDFLEKKEELLFKENGDVLYPLSLEKITRMYKGAIDNGFASYAEA